MRPSSFSGKNTTAIMKQKGEVQIGKMYFADFPILHRAAHSRGK